MRTTKNAVKMRTAPVRLQVAPRVGQRTWRSSNHAPLKYLPAATNGRSRIEALGRFDVDDGLTVTFSLVGLVFFDDAADDAFMRVTFLPVSLFVATCVDSPN